MSFLKISSVATILALSAPTAFAQSAAEQDQFDGTTLPLGQQDQDGNLLFRNPKNGALVALLQEPMSSSDFPEIFDDIELRGFIEALKTAQTTGEAAEINDLMTKVMKIANDFYALPAETREKSSIREQYTESFIDLLYNGHGAEKRPEIFKLFASKEGDKNKSLGFTYKDKNSSEVAANLETAKAKLRLAVIKTAGLLNNRAGSLGLTQWEVNRMSEALRGIAIKPRTNAQGKKYEPKPVQLDFKYLARNAYQGDQPLRVYAMSAVMKSYADAAAIMNSMGRDTVTIRTRRGNTRARRINILSGSGGEAAAQKLLGANIGPSKFCAQSWRVMIEQAAKATGSYDLLTLNKEVNSALARKVSQISHNQLTPQEINTELKEEMIKPNAYWANITYKGGGKGHAGGILVTPDPTDPEGKRMILTELQFNTTQAREVSSTLASRSGGIIDRGSRVGTKLGNESPFGALDGCVSGQCKPKVH